MTAQEWAGFVLTLFSIGALVLGGLRWYIAIQIKPIAEAVEDIRSETKTNGGSSMRDEIKSIKLQAEEDRAIRLETNKKVEHIYEVLLDYVAKNSN
jgi:hypothetical protein